MKKRKTLQDLTIKDNFMFGAVMSVEENCKGFLEMVLGFPIARVVVSKEKSMIYHPEYKGVRLDIYAQDANHTHYNIEMQVHRKKALGKRSCTIFLNTKGKNDAEVPPELVRFLKFVTADLEESERDFQDELVSRFQKNIREIKTDLEMGERYMIFEEMLREEKQEGMQEGRLEATRENILELLEDLGEIPEDLQTKLEDLEDLIKLKSLHKIASKAESLRAFEEKAEIYFNPKDKK